MGAMICLCFVLLFSVWSYGGVMPTSLRIIEIASVIGFLFALPVAFQAKEKTEQIFRKNFPGIVPFCFLVVYILIQALNNAYTANPPPHYGLTWQEHIKWLPHSADTVISTNSLILLVTYYLLFITTKVIINSRNREKFFLTFIIIIGGIQAILATMQFLAPQKFEHHYTGSFVNINNYVAYINVLIPVTLAFGRNLQCYAQNKQHKSHPGYIFYFLGAMMIYTVFTSSCLAGIAICFATVVTMLLIELFPYFIEQKHLPMTMMKILAVTIPVLIVVIMLNITGLDKLKDSITQLENIDSTLNGRAAIYDATWKMFNDGNQVYGVGIGTFQPTSIYYLRQNPDYTWYPKFAHSDILQYLTELGIAGFSILVAFILTILLKTKLLKSFIKQKHLLDSRKYIHKRLHNRMQVAIIFALSGLLAHSVVDFPLHIPAITILAVVLAALLRKYKPKKKTREDKLEI